MLKRFILFAALVLSACTGDVNTSDQSADQGSKDAFLSRLQTDFPATLSKVADNVWVHTTNYQLPGQNPIPVNGLVVVDGDEVTLVDGAWGELATLSLIEKVKAETGKPVTKMIVTHHHADRTAGVDAAEYAGLQIFTHPDTPVLAAKAGFPVPNTSVSSLKNPQSRTKVGDLEVAYPGPGYTQDNLIVYVPAAKILYGGSLVRGAEAKSLGDVSDSNLTAWPTALKWAKATYPDATIVVPEHGKGANLSLIDATIALLADAKASETDVSETGDTDEAP